MLRMAAGAGDGAAVNWQFLAVPASFYSEAKSNANE